MNFAAPRAWRLTGSAPVLTLRNRSMGVRQWMLAMGHTSSVVRGLSLQRELLPEPDLVVLIDPLQATGLNIVPSVAERIVPEARIPEARVHAPSSHRMQPATPMAGLREQRARSDSGHQDARPASGSPASGSFATQPEASLNALEDARRAGSQPARLATILQRHAGSVAQLRADRADELHADDRTGASAPTERGTVSIGQAIEAAASQRQAADRKVVYLPARASPSVAMPDALRAAAGPARWEANMAATLDRWVQAGASMAGVRGAEFSSQGAVAGIPARRLQGGVADMAARLPNSVQNAGRAAAKPINIPAMSVDKLAESADIPASASPSATVAASAARLEQALRAATLPITGNAENPHATTQPVIESLARIVEQLTSIEMKFSQTANVSEAAVGSSEATAPAVQWLEDDDLAGRLQGILRRQAKRRGIDLS